MPHLHSLFKMSEIIRPNFGNVSQQTWDRFYRYAQDQQKADKYFTRQRLLATKNAHKGDGVKAVDGIGENYATMDSRTYHRQLQNDEHFWKDPSNVVKFFKDNPQYLNETNSGSTYKV